ncbi:DNA-binding CsgD family transcriptional regulator [Aliiruegeria haliotis]|uniref:DNA-binding CsgD family transcriptional regulator n=1 Tax=Aliiruegeria haliotis TaxID=1280846 RepID=A0A2T0RJQ6_9RHOB|nr:DNA-binding CsgD family transcriptional regulator [Aliiruegeria haliotis]
MSDLQCCPRDVLNDLHIALSAVDLDRWSALEAGLTPADAMALRHDISALRRARCRVDEAMAEADAPPVVLCYADDGLAIPQDLSPRQMEVLIWIARGKSNDVIARILGISRHTVDTHVRRIFEKFGTCDRTVAAVRAVAAGLVCVEISAAA